MASKVINAPLCLWIAPEFTQEMQEGKAPAPYIDHDKIDFHGLADVLDSEFQTRPQGISIRVPDDTIDQTTVHMRMMGIRAGEIDCRDFGKIMMELASESDSRIIPVRAAWSSLHFLKNRRHAPPPVALPFVAIGAVEDFLDWLHVAYLTLHVQVAQQPDLLLNDSIPPEDFEGQLTKGLQDYCESAFGVGYKPFTQLHPMQPVPEIAQYTRGIFG